LIHPVLVVLKALVPSLAQALGSGAEVVLHELSHPEDSVIAIAGDVTGRKVGAHLTNLVLHLLREDMTGSDVINYANRTADGRYLRSSTLFIHDEKGQAIACLCLNFDLTKWMVVKHLIDNYCEAVPLEEGVQETFTSNIESLLEESIEQAVARRGIPVAMMKKEHKLRVVQELDSHGVFLVKRAVSIVAQSLRVSRFTIYNYLNEIRNSNYQTSA